MSEAEDTVKELDKLLKLSRSPSIEERCYAIVSFATVLNNNASPKILNKIFLHFAEVFRADDTNHTRVWVLWLFTTCSSLIPVVKDRAELLKRAVQVLESNNILARTLTWRLIGTMPTVVAEQKIEVDLQTKARQTLMSSGTDDLERCGLLGALMEINKVDNQIFGSLVPLCWEKIKDISVDHGTKLKFLQWIQHCDAKELLRNNVFATLGALMASNPASSFVCESLNLIAHVAVHCSDGATRLHMVEALVHFVDKDSRTAVNLAALRGLLWVVRTPRLQGLPTLWAGLLQALLRRLEDTSHPHVQFVILHLMHQYIIAFMGQPRGTRGSKEPLHDVISAAKTFLWHPCSHLVVVALHILHAYLQCSCQLGTTPDADVLPLCMSTAAAALHRQCVLPCACATAPPNTKRAVPHLATGARPPPHHSVFLRLLQVLLQFMRLQLGQAAAGHSHLLQLLTLPVCRVRRCLLLQCIAKLHAPRHGAPAADAETARRVVQQVWQCLQLQWDEAVWAAGWDIIFTVSPQAEDSWESTASPGSSGASPPCGQQIHGALQGLLQDHQWWPTYVAARAAVLHGWYGAAHFALAGIVPLVDSEEAHAWLQTLLLLCRCEIALRARPLIAPPAALPPTFPQTTSSIVKTLSDATMRMRTLAVAGTMRSAINLRIAGGKFGRAAFQVEFLTQRRAMVQAFAMLCVALQAPCDAGGGPDAHTLGRVAQEFQSVAQGWTALATSFIDIDACSLAFLTSEATLCDFLHNAVKMVLADPEAEPALPRNALPVPQADELSALLGLLQASPARRRADVMQKVAQVVAQMPRALPPYFFAVHPNTSLTLSVTPTGNPVTTTAKTALVFAFEGMVMHRTCERLRPVKSVRIHVLNTFLARVPDDRGLGGDQPDRGRYSKQYTQQVPLTQEFMSALCVVLFPEEGHYQLTVTMQLVDHQDVMWDVSGGGCEIAVHAT